MKRPGSHGWKQDLVNDQLHNNENATDEELVEFFLENGLTQEEADRAIDQRQTCMLNFLYVAEI
jgi:hypothetical protein